MMQIRNSAIFWKWALVLLVLCNLGLLGTFWFFSNHRGGENRAEVRDEVISRLHFSVAQVKAYNDLITEHRDSMQVLRREGRILRDGLFGCMKGGPGAQAQADSFARLIGANQVAVEKATYLHFSKVRELGSGEQKRIFDAMIQDVTRHMNGRPAPPDEGMPPPPGRPGPPPGGPPPGP